MKRIPVIFVIMLCSMFVSCREGVVEPELNSEVLVNGLIYLDGSPVTSEVNKLTSDLTAADRDHRTNLNILIDRISSQVANLKVETSCYACIYTLPPYSEIILSVDSMGTSVRRTIVILTPEDGKLKCVGLHN